jgi:hypothetical protein
VINKSALFGLLAASSLAITPLSAASLIVQNEELIPAQTITIVGELGGIAVWTINFESNSNVGVNFQSDVFESTFGDDYAGAGSGTDVRTLCGVPRQDKVKLASTTSKDDAQARKDAVGPLVGLMFARWAATIGWNYIRGNTIKIDNENWLIAEFTFADGGTEKYYVNPLFTDNAKPVPNSMKEGDGVATGVPCSAG